MSLLNKIYDKISGLSPDKILSCTLLIMIIALLWALGMFMNHVTII